MRMSHINFNHLYYFWQVCKAGSVVGAAEALFLTPQTITGQIKALEERLDGKLFKRRGAGWCLRAGAAGVPLCRQDVYAQPGNAGYRQLPQRVKPAVRRWRGGRAVEAHGQPVLETAVVVDNEQIHLRCFESTHEMLLEQLSQHKLDMILSDCPVDSSQQEGLFSLKLGECGISFFCRQPAPELPFPACTEQRKLLIPGRRSMLGRKLLNWFNTQGIQVEILGEFDDAALMKAFGMYHNAIFVAPTLYAQDTYNDDNVVEIGRIDSVQEEYYIIFAERMIQHPAVQRVCNKRLFGAVFLLAVQ